MRIVRGNDVELAVSEAGDPAHPTVLLVHGYPDTRAVWSRVTPLLAARHHVVAYDVRGAGSSGAPAAGVRRGYDLDRLADDVIAVIDAVAPGRRVHLVGHDWGSIQGWDVVTSARADGKVASFTSISGPSLDHVGHWLRGDPRGALEQLVRSWYMWAMEVPGGAELLWKHVLGRGWPRLLRRLEGVAADDDHPAPTLVRDGVRGLALYRQNILRRLARPRREPRARVPVQLIVPRRDRFVSAAIYDAVPRWTPQLRRHDLDRGHWVVRTDPAAIAGLIAGFVDDIERDGKQAAA